MPIGQVLAHLQEQRSAAAATGTPSPTPPETPRPAAPEDADEDGDNLSRPDHQPPFMLIPEEESPQGPAESEGPGRVHAAPVQYLCRFQLHQRRHNNERPFACSTCGKGFFQASELRVHELIHAKEKPFRCGHCDRAFNHRTNLQAHERIHTGAKPYACAQCGRTYASPPPTTATCRCTRGRPPNLGPPCPGTPRARQLLSEVTLLFGTAKKTFFLFGVG
ncbi:zinc finger and SCAN domain-containing protein 4-like [Myotis yumanensis]|uniref:zinc finger and SCAN domain-containing protein 4-like n=1 Tax=Myotis yumanensis TaxID=159337 RepID=UPI0038D1D514